MSWLTQDTGEGNSKDVVAHHAKPPRRFSLRGGFEGTVILMQAVRVGRAWNGVLVLAGFG